MARFLLIIAGLLILAMALLTLLPKNGAPPKELKRLSSIQPTQPWFKEQVLENPKTVLVDFTASWCGPCQILNETLKEIDKNYGDRLAIVKVDVDKHQDLAELYGVDGIPYVFVVKQGKVVAADRGVTWYEGIENLIKPHVGPAIPENSPVTAAAAH